MSWSISISPATVEEFDAAVDAAGADLPRLVPDQEDQLLAAKAAAKALVASGALGHDGLYRGSLSGHANPGHPTPESPYMPVESISVYIQRWFQPEVTNG